MVTLRSSLIFSSTSREPFQCARAKPPWISGLSAFFGGEEGVEVVLGVDRHGVRVAIARWRGRAARPGCRRGCRGRRWRTRSMGRRLSPSARGRGGRRRRCRSSRSRGPISTRSGHAFLDPLPALRAAAEVALVHLHAHGFAGEGLRAELRGELVARGEDGVARLGLGRDGEDDDVRGGDAGREDRGRRRRRAP